MYPPNPLLEGSTTAMVAARICEALDSGLQVKYDYFCEEQELNTEEKEALANAIKQLSIPPDSTSSHDGIVFTLEDSSHGGRRLTVNAPAENARLRHYMKNIEGYVDGLRFAVRDGGSPAQQRQAPDSAQHLGESTKDEANGSCVHLEKLEQVRLENDTLQEQNRVAKEMTAKIKERFQTLNGAKDRATNDQASTASSTLQSELQELNSELDHYEKRQSSWLGDVGQYVETLQDTVGKARYYDAETTPAATAKATLEQIHLDLRHLSTSLSKQTGLSEVCELVTVLISLFSIVHLLVMLGLETIQSAKTIALLTWFVIIWLLRVLRRVPRVRQLAHERRVNPDVMDAVEATVEGLDLLVITAMEAFGSGHGYILGGTVSAVLVLYHLASAGMSWCKVRRLHSVWNSKETEE